MQFLGEVTHLGKSHFRKALIGLFVLFVIAANSQTTKVDRIAAIRLNNVGVALMNQQLAEKALAKFDEALQKDPGLTTAELNKGIALLSQQKLKEAETVLNHVASLEANNPRVWYNLGLVHRGEARNEEGITDFKKVISIDPNDADAHYFLGSLYLQAQQYEPAATEFEAALKINRFHASSEFGLARSLQRLGKAEESRVHFKAFEHLTREKIASPITSIYGEQGRYSLAQEVFLPEPNVGPMIPVNFVSSAAETKTSGEKSSGSVCQIDIDGDGRPDIVVLGNGDPAVQVFLNQGGAKFKETSAGQYGLALKGRAVSCAVGDFDNDGRADLAIALEDRLELFKNSADGKFVDVTKDSGIESLNVPAGMLFVDFDHDGDLDLFVAGRAINVEGKTKEGSTNNVLWRNNGNGKFTNWTTQSGVEGENATVEAVLSDLNNDRSVDLLVTGAASPMFYANQREAKFTASPLLDSSLSPTLGAVVFDFDKDGWMDVAFTHIGKPGVSLWKNLEGKKFERVSLPVDGEKGWGVTAVDFDNDGWIDLAVVVETAKGAEVRLLRNQGAQGFVDVTKNVGLDNAHIEGARGVIASDIDGDGDSDLLVSRADGPPVVLRNDGGNKNHSFRISLKGLADNKSAIGTKVEVFADGLWQKWEVGGASGYLGQGSSEILAGLGTHDRVDVLRMLWPTGVLQDEIDVAIANPPAFTELDRRGSSCPTLFAWDGKKYQFISDVIGAAVVGHWVSPTERNVADPDEWVKVDGSQLKARNGRFSLRFGEPMEEVNFIDQLRLVAVDHPEGNDVYPNERFVSAPPFPEEKTIMTSAPHQLAGAWDDLGRDVRAVLEYRDHNYVRDFKNIQYAGYANMHKLTLDLGPWTETNPLRLYMHGFIEYFTATSMYAAWQAKIDPIAPYVEAQMPDGTWNRVIDDMGFPAGLPRTIFVDLTGKLPAGTRKIRIGTNLQIYWDQILVDNGPEKNTARVTELPLVGADLQFRGYPEQIDGKTPGDLTYVYERASKTGPFSHERGNYTRYGNVTELLKGVDDHYVIFGSGEDVDAEFSAAPLPLLPKGWKRDYFFYAYGYVKDMDFYEASPFTVNELPFRKMTSYPYPSNEHYPDDADSVDYRLNWNDRFDSGEETSTGYGFHYEARRP